MDENDQLIDELIEHGAYEVVGQDAEGNDILRMNHEKFKEYAPDLYDYVDMETRMELEETLFSLEEKGLIVSNDDGTFSLTEAGEELKQFMTDPPL